ncbi:dynein heavy chain, cytoplasmic [Caerostris extrusa]|uniref:Dynein heavy chain, cytoplasmic n=1 Tax=Caerostris extrusa TaxID=172846 RepID=A0AAV4MZ98_CAEEX|nr:dynein heavy chain, cytoplasmic [Caerostris extrusa]
MGGKLNRINALFDVWIDVQRRWVYLEGIFSGSADIQTLLPVETSRFQSISAEFLTLMKKVTKSLLERSSFPRFYFVGDEDLLEIIGNSKNIPRLQKHFKKMFAGVAAIILDEEDTVVTGIASKEGEEVVFSNRVSIKEHPKINEWLTLVEKEMRLTLATLLASAVSNIGPFKGGKLTRKNT